MKNCDRGQHFQNYLILFFSAVNLLTSGFVYETQFVVELNYARSTNH